MGAILSGMDTTAAQTGVQWADRAYWGNGRNLPRKWDGVAWNFMSIQKYNNGVAGNSNFQPVVADAAVAGNLIGNYVYLVVAVNSQHKTVTGFNTSALPSLQSAPSGSVAGTVLNVNASQITLSGIPATHADPQVDGWDIYRNKAGDLATGVGFEFKLVANIPIGTTSYQDNIADSQLTSTFTVRTNQNYCPAAKYMELYGSRVWFAGFDPITTGTVAKDVASFTLTGGTTQASTTVTMASTTGVVIGQTVVGTGIPLYAYVVSFVVNTSMVISAAATATGSPTLTFDSPLVDFTSVSLPDGVLGCWFQVTGDPKRYRIVSRVTATQVTLDHGYSGAMPANTYTIFRDPWELYYSDFRDPEACGPDSEGRRFMFNVPDRKPITGLLTYFDRLLVFTRSDIYAVTGQGPNTTDMAISTHPTYKDIGAPQVRHYGGMTAVATVEQEIYGLDQVKGPWVMRNGAPPMLIGYPLLLDWLAGLTDADLSIAVVGVVAGGRYVEFSVVAATGDTENGKTFRYDRKLQQWYEQTKWHPSGYPADDGDNGVPETYMIQSASMFLPYVGTTDIFDQSATVIKGTLTSATTTTATDAGAAFPTAAGGLVEAYVDFFDTNGVFVGSRRINSNTATALTWLSTGAGGGALAGLQAGYTYEIGSIWWKWKSKTFGSPGQAARTYRAYVLFESSVSSGSHLTLTQFVDGRQRTPSHTLPVDVKQKPFDLNVRAIDFAIQVESRDGATVRDMSFYAAPKEPKGGGA